MRGRSRSRRREACPASARSKGRHLERHQVVDPHGFLGEEWLAVAASDERSVVRGLVAHDVVERFAVRVDLAGLDGAVELRRVALERRDLRLEVRGDVDDEGRLLVILAVRDGVEELVRTMGRLVGFDFREPRDETGIADELGRDAVIGVAAARRRRDDHARAEPADRDGEGAPGLRCIDYRRVREAEVFADRKAEGLRGRCRLGGARRRVAAGPHLALGEVEDPGAVAVPGEARKRAPAGQLRVVAV